MNLRCSITPQLTQLQCQALRGVAIAAIVLHNYSHWLRGMVQENEYQFFQSNVEGLLRVVSQGAAYLPVHLLSFFGHYGVPIFLFLSGYGLERKYGLGTQPLPSVTRFVGQHWLKLFRMMVVGYVAFLLVDGLLPHGRHYTAVQVAMQLLMANNLLSDPDRQIWPGPYWYFGLMVQVYLLWRVALCRRPSWLVGLLMVVCTSVQLLMEPEGETINWYRYNALGSMLPLGVGVLWARHATHHLPRWQWLIMGVAAVVMVVLLGLDFVSWMLTPAIVCLCAVSVALATPSVWVRPAAWLGKLSAALFVVHPLTRRIIIPLSQQGEVYLGLLLYALSSVALAWLLHRGMRYVPRPSL